MNKSKIYKRYQFPSEIIQYAVLLYFRFNLSHSDIEDLLAERGINVSYEAIRLWCNRFGPKYAARLKKKHRGYGDTVNQRPKLSTYLHPKVPTFYDELLVLN